MSQITQHISYVVIALAMLSINLNQIFLKKASVIQLLKRGTIYLGPLRIGIFLYGSSGLYSETDVLNMV